MSYRQSMYSAVHNPFRPYPKTITYTLGKMTGTGRSHMPSGDTYENNAYTRYLRMKLNVRNDDVFELLDGSSSYDERVHIAIASDKLPDIFLVNDDQTLRQLIARDKICDLKYAYDKCASTHIQNIYASYGADILNRVRDGDKMYALPETNIDNGPSLLWLRHDWLEKLGLPTPKTIDDVRNIVKAFMQQDPGHNGPGNTVGLVTVPELVGENGESENYQTDIIFAAFGAYPGHWLKRDLGATYGSIQPGARKALSYLHDMYEEGTLDRDFLFRDSDNITDLIVKGKCGAFFGTWSAPTTALMKSLEADPSADWRPYLIETDSDGSTSFAAQNPTGRYVVVRKGFEHPELVMKVISVLFDFVRYGDEDTKELESYYKNNVDPSAMPFSINVDYKDSLSKTYDHLADVLIRKSKDTSSLDLHETNYYESCRDYLNAKDTGKAVKPEDWATYTSRIIACHKISDGQTKEVQCRYFSDTATMKKEWYKLHELEQKTYISIITGDEPLSAFDDFVKEWKIEGGSKITREVKQLAE